MYFPTSRILSLYNFLAFKVPKMATLKMNYLSVIVGSNLGTSIENRMNRTTLASREFGGLKMMPSLKATSFKTESKLVHATPSMILAK